MFFKFWLKAKTTDQSLLLPNWPSYLHNKCNNPLCRYPNPPQAAKGKYVCSGTYRGRQCHGTYRVKEDAVVMVMKQHRLAMRKNENQRRKVVERPVNFRPLDIPQAKSLPSSSGVKKSLPITPSKVDSDVRSKVHPMPPKPVVDVEDERPPKPPPKPTKSVVKNTPIVEPIEHPPPLPSKGKNKFSAAEHRLRSRSTPVLPSASRPKDSATFAVDYIPMLPPRPTPKAKVIANTPVHIPQSHGQVPYLAKEKLPHRSRNPI